MTEPTQDQQDEMLDLLRRTHLWIDGMQTAGLDESIVVSAIHAALVERLLRAGGAEKAAQWLQAQATMTAQLGPAMIAEMRAQRR
ncbi:hypothetical protein [Sphingobium xenophagum]|nr:hypothetical protein [Sphingobium xenophagum]